MSIRCMVGIHRWRRISREWLCVRCARRPKQCRNCGVHHDPTATLVVCTVTQ